MFFTVQLFNLSTFKLGSLSFKLYISAASPFLFLDTVYVEDILPTVILTEPISAPISVGVIVIL